MTLRIKKISPRFIAVQRVNDTLKLDYGVGHQARIAVQTLDMPDAMVGVMGGPTKAEAHTFLKSIGYARKS